jgi:release factor glutamine methyltransferase
LFLDDLQKLITKTFLDNKITTYSLDARIVLREVLNLDEKEFILQPKIQVSSENLGKIQKIVERRLKGEPISKIFGRRDFYSSTFLISTEVLDPRPESELIVDIANNFILDKKFKNVIDLGTGSGCILLSILKENKKMNGIGTDISFDAINIAKKNSSNLPYISSTEITNLSSSVKNYDPLVSLDGGSDGLVCYKEIADNLNRIIRKNGRIILEIGYNQADDVIKIFESKEFYLLKKYNDISGLDRILTFETKKT